MHMYVSPFQKFKTATTEAEGIVSHKTIVASQNNWKRLKIFEVILRCLVSLDQNGIN